MKNYSLNIFLNKNDEFWFVRVFTDLEIEIKDIKKLFPVFLMQTRGFALKYLGVIRYEEQC